MAQIISIFGSNSNISNDLIEEVKNLGKVIVDNGYIICCGGRDGIMAAIAEGARSSKLWTGKEIIGIIPSGDKKDANRFIDIVIPSGLGLYRNMLVARAGEACIAIAGGAGTLSEIAFAWQIGRPIAILGGSGGWAERLGGEKIDHRREMPVVTLSSVENAIEWIHETLND